MSLNKVMLIGNLGRDPDIKVTEKTTIASFSIATSTKKGGEDKTEWHRCTAFGKTAEVIQKYVTKGSKLYVEGSLQTREYKGKDGIQKTVTEIVVWNVDLISPKKESETTPVEDDSSDIPF